MAISTLIFPLSKKKKKLILLGRSSFLFFVLAHASAIYGRIMDYLLLSLFSLASSYSYWGKSQDLAPDPNDVSWTEADDCLLYD